MKRFVNGDEYEFDSDGIEIVQLSDRVIVRTPQGSFSAVSVRLDDGVLISYKGNQYRVEERRPRTHATAQAGSGELRAPMPGQIVDIRHNVGANLRKGETVLVLEAMKTQQPFNAPFDGTLTDLFVSKGDQVSDGFVLAIIKSLGSDNV